ITLVLDLARMDRPDGRQFLTNVIQTLYDSGKRDLAQRIIDALITDDNHYSNLLAVQCSYQLKLDRQLVELALSENPILRDTASIYLYQRWNRSRLDGNLEDAYQPIDSIVSSIRIRNPRRS